MNTHIYNLTAQTNMNKVLDFLLPVSKALPTVKYVDQCKQIQVEKYKIKRILNHHIFMLLSIAIKTND